jgi:hypothetical protein
MGEVGFIAKPELERGFIWWERRMRHAILYVYGGLNGKWPEPIAQICVNEESACHGSEREVAPFCNPILVRRVWYRFLVRDSGSLTKVFEFPMNKFRRIVDAKRDDFGPTEIFDERFEIAKVLSSFIA